MSSPSHKSSRQSISRHPANKLLVLGLTLGLLAFSLACGSSGPSIPITGNFSNSSLQGNYTFHLYGLDTTGNQYAEAGVFIADGNGHITSGTDDFNQFGSSILGSNAITGTYSIGNDGNGQITFALTNVSPPNTFQVAVTLVSTSKLYMTEVDLFANAAGEATKQDTSAFSAAPSGTFAFRIHNLGSTTDASLVGAMTSAAGALSGTLDELRAGALHTGVTVTAGSFAAPDTTSGRGTMTFTDSLGITSSYIYYVIDTSTVELLQSDINNLSLGRLEKQSGGPYSLSGNYVFGSTGDTAASILGVRSAGGFTSDGTTITGGVYDSVQDGSQVVAQAFNGTFAATGNGRVAVTLTPQGANPITEVFWMVNSGRAFFLISDPSKTEDGTIDIQQTTTFSNSSLKGQYGYINDGFDPNQFLTRVGTYIPDGNGNVNLNEVVNGFTPANGALINAPIVPGTYTVDATGRVTSTLTGSNGNIDLVMYMVSPGQAYVLQNDSGIEISGKMTLQVSP